MYSLGKGVLKMGGAAIILAVLFCLFLCPHDSKGIGLAQSGGSDCQDLCDCSDHGERHECELDVLHSHEFRNEISKASDFNLDELVWVYIVYISADVPQAVTYSHETALSCIYSYAVRHLDTIILRV
jgi:hypothetical protein